MNVQGNWCNGTILYVFSKIYILAPRWNSFSAGKLSCYCVHYPWSPHHVERKKPLQFCRVTELGKLIGWIDRDRYKCEARFLINIRISLENIKYMIFVPVLQEVHINFVCFYPEKKRFGNRKSDYGLMHRFGYMYTFVQKRHFAYSFIKQLSKISVNMKLRNAWSERIKPRYLNLYDIWVNTLRLQQPSCRLLQNDLSRHLVHYHYYRNGSWKHVLSNRILALLSSQHGAFTCYCRVFPANGRPDFW